MKKNRSHGRIIQSEISLKHWIAQTPTVAEARPAACLGCKAASCVRHVEQALGRTEGVKTASVNFALARATVVYDPTRTNEDALAAAVTRAGYEVPRVQRTRPNQPATTTA